MSHATMTLPALYDYAKNVHNVDIFDGMTVPSLIDRSTLIDLLMLRSAPFELLYPNVDYMHAAITTWALTHKRTFDKWADALQINYDPLNNYDRTEESTESGIESRIRKHDEKAHNTESESNDTETMRKGSQNSATIGSTKSNGTNDATTTNSVSAYDSAAWQNADKSVSGTGTTNTAADMQAVNGTDSDETSTQTDRVTDNVNKVIGGENENALNSKSLKLRAFGNIGVTTSQQMLESELNIDAWNIYEHIADLFLDEFCVLLY